MDVIYEQKIRNSDMLISYNFPILQKSKLVDLIGGMFDLSIKETRKFSLPDFRKRCREFFNELPGKVNYQIPIEIIISLTGFKDKITYEVEAKNPFRKD